MSLAALCDAIYLAAFRGLTPRAQLHVIDENAVAFSHPLRSSRWWAGFFAKEDLATAVITPPLCWANMRRLRLLTGDCRVGMCECGRLVFFAPDTAELYEAGRALQQAGGLA